MNHFQSIIKQCISHYLISNRKESIARSACQANSGFLALRTIECAWNKEHCRTIALREVIDKPIGILEKRNEEPKDDFSVWAVAKESDFVIRIVYVYSHKFEGRTVPVSASRRQSVLYSSLCEKEH